MPPNAASTANCPPGEATPLLPHSMSLEEDHFADDGRGRAGVTQTVFNLMKTCMGTGTLALAFACQQGGIVLFTATLFAVAAWNAYAVHRLLACLQYIPSTTSAVVTKQDSAAAEHQQQSVQQPPDSSLVAEGRGYTAMMRDDEETPAAAFLADRYQHLSYRSRRPPPPRGTSTLGRVAWYALGGQAGLYVLDIMFVLLLLGIIVAYVAATISFMGDTSVSLGKVPDAVAGAVLMVGLSLVPDVGYLHASSAAGLTVLLAAFAVIAVYGVLKRGDGNNVDHPENEDNSDSQQLDWWPPSAAGLSHLFGIAVFGYGVVPMTYNYHESMKRPERLMGATWIALVATAGLYALIGVGLYVLFPGLTADVLHEIPATGIVPLITRLALTGTIIMTAPLIIIPCAELIDGKLVHLTPASLDYWQHHKWRAAVRLGIVGFCVFVAILLPSFVEVLSFVGCFCVAMVGFCMPPLLHLRLVYLSLCDVDTSSDDISLASLDRMAKSWTRLAADGLMLTWGVVATLLSTSYTLRQLLHSNDTNSIS